MKELLDTKLEPELKELIESFTPESVPTTTLPPFVIYAKSVKPEMFSTDGSVELNLSISWREDETFIEYT